MSKRFKRFLVVLCLTSCSWSFASERPDYSAYRGSFFIPFTTDSSYEQHLNVRARINDGPIVEMLVDTGSSVTLISKSLVASFDQQGPAGLTEIPETGQISRGTVSPLKVEFIDALGEGAMNGQVAVSQVTGLVVNEIVCAPDVELTKACEAGPAHDRVRRMGVGFGQLDGIALFNLPQVIQGELRAGYILEPKGIRVGLTARDATPDFNYVKLEKPRVAGLRQNLWAYPQTDLTVNVVDSDMPYLVHGRFLMDTGIRSTLAGITGAPRHGKMPNGTEIYISPRWLGGQGPQIQWIEGNGQAAPLPRGHWTKIFEDVVTGWGDPFINTGIRPLSRYRSLYDAEGGYWGLAPR
jgi:Aspartyl protease